MKQVCYDLDNMKAVTMPGQFVNGVNSMTCGSKVQSTIGFAAINNKEAVDLNVFSGTVGRVTIQGSSDAR